MPVAFCLVSFVGLGLLLGVSLMIVLLFLFA